MKRILIMGMMVATLMFSLTAISFAGQGADKAAGGMMYTKSAVNLRMDIGNYGETMLPIPEAL